MIMTLGLFVWGIDTLSYQTLQRTTNWRYGRNNRIGKRAASQFIGPGDDTIILQGWVADELGETASIDTLRTMGDKGEPYVMVSALGEVFGLWEINELSTTNTLFWPNGQPRKIDFTLNLTRVDDDQIDQVDLISSLEDLL